MELCSQSNKQGSALWCMEFVDELTGITFGDAGIIKQTTNGGLTWIERSGNTSNTLKKSVILTDDNIVVVGLYGTILKSTDVGETWVAKSTGITTDLHGISFGGRFSEVGIAVGSNSTILRTTDLGETWNIVFSGNEWQKTTGFKAIALSSELKGVLAGDNGTIMLTSDGGLTWFRCPSDVPNINFNFIRSLSEDIFYITGENGTIIRSEDGGVSWMTLNTGVTNTIYRISFADEFQALAVGGEGTIIKTTDGGNSWSKESSGTTNNLNCLFLVNELTAFTGGNDEIILKTTDGGSSWIEYSEGSGRVNAEDDNVVVNCYPNPSNPETKINYTLSQNADIKIKIYNSEGREIKTLLNTFQETGKYSVTFSGAGLSSGIYFCRITVRTINSIKAKTMKIILVK
ncbi:MAG TPA: YCF48-related protein [Ignavibacteria bacterium]|nr:YCF48-related protein [Ignavibacteria bacterium]HRJ86816.1 YCF48-related protein [Ignavibacteria bacterium]